MTIILSNQKQWIKACEQTLHEYEHNLHAFNLDLCALCKVIDRDNSKKDILPCIFGSCSVNSDKAFPCTIMKTFPKHSSMFTKPRIRFYTILIGMLKTRKPQDFHAKNLHKITKICWEIDELIYNAFKTKATCNLINKNKNK